MEILSIESMASVDIKSFSKAVENHSLFGHVMG